MLAPNNKSKEEDKRFNADESNSKFMNYLFIRLVAMNRTFTNVDFSYSTFDTAYIRNCKFDSCNFTGCRFIGSNFHGSTFTGSKFDYAIFERTQIDNNILNTECPSLENLKQKFARTLRMNFAQLGDAESVNKAILIELNATKTHYHKAWHSKEAYYRKKYKGFDRFYHFLKWVNFKLWDYVWGHGEKPYKLAIFTLAFLIVVVFVEWFSLGSINYENLKDSLLKSPQLFLGTARGVEGLWYTFIQLIRYVVFALMMSVLIRRLSRR